VLLARHFWCIFGTPPSFRICPEAGDAHLVGIAHTCLRRDPFVAKLHTPARTQHAITRHGTGRAVKLARRGRLKVDSKLASKGAARIAFEALTRHPPGAPPTRRLEPDDPRENTVCNSTASGAGGG